MAFSDRKEVRVNRIFLYRMGDILTCPVCRVEWYRALRDIYQGDHIVSGQVEPMNDAPWPDGIEDKCPKCFGGGRISLIALTPGMVKS